MEQQAVAKEGLDVRSFEFPRVTAADMAFGCFDADPRLLAEAKRRGFYCKDTPYNKLFSTLFFKGGAVKFKADVPEDFKAKAWPYLRSFMGSFSPSHEDKSAISALLLSEMCEPEIAA